MTMLPSPEFGERWFLVRTQPHREVWADEQLRRQGFVSYLPRTERTIRHARKLLTRTAAYFPCYLFIRLDLARDRWRSINGTFGVSYIVARGDRPTPVPDGVVENVMAAGGELGLLAPPMAIPGQVVRMVSGPFSDQIGIVQRLDGPGRVRLLLDLMGGKISVVTNERAMVAA